MPTGPRPISPPAIAMRAARADCISRDAHEQPAAVHPDGAADPEGSEHAFFFGPGGRGCAKFPAGVLKTRRPVQKLAQFLGNMGKFHAGYLKNRDQFVRLVSCPASRADKEEDDDAVAGSSPSGRQG